MATLNRIEHTQGEGLYSSTATPYEYVYFWRANFNIPTPDPGSEFFTVQNEATDFDLSNFVPGLEICAFDSRVYIDGPMSTSESFDVDIELKKPDASTVIASYSYTGYPDSDIPSDEIWYWVYWFNIGVASWEVDVDGTYYFETTVTGDVSGSKTTQVDFLNVPDTTQISESREGAIWVEGNYLAMVNANGFKHRILGTTVGNSGNTPGYIWLSDNSSDGTDGYVCFIDDSGEKRSAPWRIKQFESSFSNSANGEIYAGTSEAGKMWMDTEYGYTHIGYINNDGYKYIFGAGNYPYDT